tara:strand:- start:404 stop:862 length:459 start_codon:yes stop_codon:yes gene_type:complete
VIYTLHKNFITQTQRYWILNYAKEHFIDISGGLLTKGSKNESDEFSKELKKIISPIIDYTKWKQVRIGLAEYVVGDGCVPHQDDSSSHTIVCNLTDDYDGGEFYLNKKHIPIGIGDVLIFNGNKYLHEVKKIKRGYRASLSVWYEPHKKEII